MERFSTNSLGFQPPEKGAPTASSPAGKPHPKAVIRVPWAYDQTLRSTRRHGTRQLPGHGTTNGSNPLSGGVE
jgi:hypothetical protein